MMFYDLYGKKQNNTLPGGFKMGPRENYYQRFPAGVQKEEIHQWRQALHNHGRDKRRHLTLCWGNE